MDLAHFWNTSGAYQINQSLRFNSADSTVLSLAASTSNTSTKFTFSFWMKPAKIGGATGDVGIWRVEGPNSSESAIQIGYNWNAIGDAKIGCYWHQPGTGNNYNGGATNAVYRDPSSWYHFVIAIDTTQASGPDRFKVYANGVLQDRTFDTSNYIPQNYAAQFNAYTQKIGEGANFYLSEFYLIRDQALTPSSFGETDAITGAWIPKKYAAAYGSKDIYFKFESSGVGADSSGNGNNFTATGFVTSGTGTDVMSDTPTNNYVTWNPLTGYGTYSEGNLRGVTTTNDPRSVVSSMSVNEGKWYCEVTCTSITVDCAIGITPSTFPRDVNSRNYSFGDNVTYYSGTGNKHVDGSSSAYGSSYTTNDVIGIALDIDSNQLTFYKNGVSQGTISKTFSGFYNISCTSGASADSQTVTLNGGQRSFEYTQPSGFKAWNTANLPEPTIKKGSQYFNTVLYTGTGTTNAITGVGFQPDFVWGKRRSDTGNNWIFDAVRGAGNQIVTNNTNAEVPGSTEFASFDSNGFTVTSTAGSFNASSSTYVAWNWKANGAGSSNTDGSITSTVSANASAGFSIVTYTGTGSAATVGHGLGVAPSFYVVKPRSVANNWPCYHKNLTSANYYIHLNLTLGEQAASVVWNGTAPSSTVFNIGTNTNVNQSGETFVAYCFSEVAGYSKFGSYTGNGSADGPFVFCGFRPKWVMVKSTTSIEDWPIFDLARNTYNPSNSRLDANRDRAEAVAPTFDLLSNGFKLRENATGNSSGQTYIFAAFAEHPFKYANAR